MGLFRTDEKDEELNIGDRVRIRTEGIEGFITGTDGKNYLVLINNSATIEKYTVEELEKIWQEVLYGYVPNTVSGDGEELDCYILGVDKPVNECKR